MIDNSIIIKNRKEFLHQKYVLFTVISSLITLLTQIPISTIGDKYNKKIMLLISNFFSFLSILLFIIPLIGAISLLLIGILNNFFGIILIISIQFLFDIEYNGMISILHSNINDKSRVTVKGFLSVITNLFGLIFGLIITIILKFVEVHTMYIISGVILFLYLIILFIKYKR